MSTEVTGTVFGADLEEDSEYSQSNKKSEEEIDVEVDSDYDQ